MRQGHCERQRKEVRCREKELRDRPGKHAGASSYEAVGVSKGTEPRQYGVHVLKKNQAKRKDGGGEDGEVQRGEEMS